MHPNEPTKIMPQRGAQEDFFTTAADIAVYGGAAGSGKTWAVLLEALRHVTNTAEFAAVFFRRTTVQVRNVGGLWDESMKLYPLTGAVPSQNVLEWKWEGGGKVKFAHLEHERNKLDWQGAQIPLIVFDELTHFSESQFFYIMSRNRSMCGVRPYIRATCNPDADSWVARLLEWWIDQDTGFPIQERAGVVRWFIRINDTMIWADTREELVEKYGDPLLPADHETQPQPKSVTFVPGKLTDNPELMKADPGYLANLKALPFVEQERLLGGNWKVRASAGLMFKRSWCEVVDVAPANMDVVRYWDLAATKKTDSNDPDWTSGVKLAKHRETGVYYVMDVTRMRESPFAVKTSLYNTATSDGTSVRIGIPQDPGQAGKSQAQDLIAHLSGFTISSRREGGDKTTRFGPFSAQCEAGNVKFLRGHWNEDVFNTLEGFPQGKHDDDADACSGAFEMLTNAASGLLDFYRQAAQQKEAQAQIQANNLMNWGNRNG